MYPIHHLLKWFFAFLYVLTWHFQGTNAAIEEIEATPTNTNAFELGDISMPQFLVFCIMFLLIVTLYAYSVIPIEVDLGYFYGTGSGELFPRNFGPRKFGHAVDLTTLLYNCPLQYVCEVDMWANRDDHEFFVEKMVASWFKNPNSTFHSAKSTAFGGTGSCTEMYPCPFDVQEVLGIRIPGFSNNIVEDDDSGADIHMDLTA